LEEGEPKAVANRAVVRAASEAGQQKRPRREVGLPPLEPRLVVARVV